MRNLLAAITAVALAACAGVDPIALDKVQDRDVLALDEDLVWSTKEEEMPLRLSIPRHGGDYNHRLKAGEYVAVYENDRSRYYLGPQNCLANEVTRLTYGLPANWPIKVGHTTTFGTCGLILPKSGDGPARVFFVGSTAVGKPANATSESLSVARPAATGDPLVNVAVQQATANPNVSIGSGVVGAAVGTALVGAIMDAEARSWMEYPWLWNGLQRSLLIRR